MKHSFFRVRSDELTTNVLLVQHGSSKQAVSLPICENEAKYKNIKQLITNTTAGLY